MRKKPLQNATEARLSRALTVRLHALRSIDSRKNRIHDIMEALTSSGCRSLDDQARALGLHRSTVWTIRKNKHKVGRLSAKTIKRVIANPNTPPRVLSALQEYVSERLGDDHGDNQSEQIGIRSGTEN